MYDDYDINVFAKNYSKSDDDNASIVIMKSNENW